MPVPRLRDVYKRQAVADVQLVAGVVDGGRDVECLVFTHRCNSSFPFGIATKNAPVDVYKRQILNPHSRDRLSGFAEKQNRGSPQTGLALI